MTRTAIFALPLLAAAGLAEARSSSDREMRGFDSCRDVAAAESRGLVTSRTYYISEQEDHNRYYINASRWQDGERQLVRLDCSTSLSGRQVLSASLEEGRYVYKRPNVRIELATK